MNNEEIQTKAEELSKQHGVKVHPVLFKDGEESVIGFIKEPPRFVKMKIMDKGLISPISAASEIVDAYLIKEESDSRIYDEKPENDKFYIGAVMEAYNLVQLAVNQLKKN
jgi:hypothetical protein